MPGNEEAELVRRIVEAYRAVGIPAKAYRGRPFIYREEGWEGPLDPYVLRATYVEEIGRIERAVRAAVAEWCDRTIAEDFLGDGMDKDMWAGIRMSPEAFMNSGLSEQKARLYDSVARRLRFRGELWT
jgi:hypothetical protein